MPGVTNPPSTGAAAGGSSSTRQPSHSSIASGRAAISNNNYNHHQRAAQPTSSNMPSRYGGSQAGGLNTLASRRTQTLVAADEESPSYYVEHLATFPVGKQYGLEWPTDGIRKLKQMERSSAIWAQPMVMRLRPHMVQVENENQELVEQFHMDLVADPTAHLSSDPRDVYNNILLFVVKEDTKRGARNATGTRTPNEMHIFQCNRVSANEIVNDFREFMAGNYRNVQPGRRDTGFVVSHQAINGGRLPAPGEPVTQSYTRTESRDVQSSKRNSQHGGSSRRLAAVGTYPIGNGNGEPAAYAPDDQASATSSETETFEHDVNTLNRSFDDIERFVTRIQSAAFAQSQLEQQTKRRNKRSRSQGGGGGDPSILAMRAQLPTEAEFYDILQKFKLCFNLLAKLRHHIHEPNAPELLHFLFTPLTIILDACTWGLGRNIAPSVVSPLLARETRELLHNCLTSKESEIWRSLGEAWFIAPEDWPGPLPPPFKPVFADGFMPYGPPTSYSATTAALPPPPPPQVAASHLGVSSSRRSVDNLAADYDRMSVREMSDRERRIMETEQRLEAERIRLLEERRQLADEFERRSVSSERPMPTFYNDRYTTSANTAMNTHQRDSMRSNPVPIGSRHAVSPSMPNLAAAAAAGTLRNGFDADSPRQRNFLLDLQNRRARAVRVTYDRIGQNNKELTVSKGEYLEVLNDTKNWWECRNVHNRIGYVPHTILSIIDLATQQQQPVSNGTLVSANVSSNAYESHNRRVSGHNSASAQGSPGGASHRSADVDGYGMRPPDVDDDDPAVETHILLPADYNDETEGGGEYARVKRVPAGRQSRDQSATRVIVSRQHETREQHTNNVVDTSRVALVRESRDPRLEVHQRNAIEALDQAIEHSGQDTAQVLEALSRQQHTTTNDRTQMTISERSTEAEVAEWMTAKGFSVSMHPRSQQVLSGQTGATLFALTKPQLQQFCGNDEGQRLYSQLLVHKNLTGYTNRTGAELQAILNLRKSRSEIKETRTQLCDDTAVTTLTNTDKHNLNTNTNYKNNANNTNYDNNKHDNSYNHQQSSITKFNYGNNNNNSNINSISNYNNNNHNSSSQAYHPRSTASDVPPTPTNGVSFASNANASATNMLTSSTANERSGSRSRQERYVNDQKSSSTTVARYSSQSRVASRQQQQQHSTRHMAMAQASNSNAAGCQECPPSEWHRTVIKIPIPK